MKNASRLLIFLGFSLTSCYSQTGWSPTVDSSGSPNSYRLNQDMQECKQLATQASNGVVKESAVGIGVGGLLGAASGAAIGAFTGNPAKGAAIGATVGGLGGGAKQGLESETRYKNAYNNCLRNRGHRPLN